MDWRELWLRLAENWKPVVTAVVLVLLLAPSPVCHPLVSAIHSARQAVEGGRTDAAIPWLDSALELEPALDGLHLAAARLALAAGDPSTALRHLGEIQALEADAEATCLRTVALFGRSGSAPGLRLLESDEAACLARSGLLPLAIQAYLAQEDRDQVVAALERLAALLPEETEVWLSLGLATATVDPQASLAPLRRARALSAEAIDIADDVVVSVVDSSASGSSAFVLAQVGQALARHGEWKLAAWAFDEALALEPGYVEAEAYLGLALDRSGGNGLTHLQSAARAAPQAAIPHTFLGYHWRLAGQPELALEAFLKAAAIEPDNPAVAAEVAGAHEALGQISEAEQWYRAAAALATQEAAFWQMLADFSLRHEVEVATLALPAARNALALAPEDARAIDALAYAHHLIGDSRMADRLIRRALRIEPMCLECQLHFGLIRQALGDRASARAAWGLVLELDPIGPLGELADRMLRSIGALPGAG